MGEFTIRTMSDPLSLSPGVTPNQTLVVLCQSFIGTSMPRPCCLVTPVAQHFDIPGPQAGVRKRGSHRYAHDTAWPISRLGATVDKGMARTIK
jgi:hypothetical protein